MLRAAAYAAAAIALAGLRADPAFIVGALLLARIELALASSLAIVLGRRRRQR
jgi:hypothetical protein